MNSKRRISLEETREIGGQLGLDWGHFDPKEFQRGLEVELEHGARDPETNVTDDDMHLVGKIAWAHLKEFPDYYTRLDKLEAEAEEFWAKPSIGSTARKESQVISHILVPLDGSELAAAVLPYAKDLGTGLHAKLHFLWVFEGEMPDILAANSDASAALEAAADLTERERQAADNYLSQLVSSWRAEGIDAGGTVVEGAPAVKIIETAHSLGVDLIAMSTHGRSGLGRMVSGSVADEVVREGGIPVLLVKPPHHALETVEATGSSSVAQAGALPLTN